MERAWLRCGEDAKYECQHQHHVANLALLLTCCGRSAVHSGQAGISHPFLVGN